MKSDFYDQLMEVLWHILVPAVLATVAYTGVSLVLFLTESRLCLVFVYSAAVSAVVAVIALLASWGCWRGFIRAKNAERSQE